jgi:hypothetical protein
MILIDSQGLPKRRLREYLMLACVGITLCGVPIASRAAGTISDLDQALIKASTAAAQYSNLPACTGAVAPTCSSPAIIAEIQAAHDVAYAAVRAAEDGTGTFNMASIAIAAYVAAVPK